MENTTQIRKEGTKGKEDSGGFQCSSPGTSHGGEVLSSQVQELTSSGLGPARVHTASIYRV